MGAAREDGVLHELRLARIGDIRLRDRVARRVAERCPGHDVSSIAAALGARGFVIRVRLTEGEAPALLRDLYAAGAPPAAVVLLPADRPGSRRDPGAEASAARAFDAFSRRGGRFAPTWSWTAFVFGPLWYFRKGLYAKGLLLLLPVVLPLWTFAVSVLVSLLVLLYCGIFGNWDHYLWRVQRTQWW